MVVLVATSSSYCSGEDDAYMQDPVRNTPVSYYRNHD